MRSRGRLFAVGLCLAVVGGVEGSAVTSPLAGAQIGLVADTSFRHERHEAFSCLDCHTMSAGHGALRVRDVTDCRGCHHVPTRSERTCTECHEREELEAVTFPGDRRMQLSVRASPTVRDIAFSHTVHQDRACADCHTGGPTLAVPDLDCAACHEEHHDAASSQCMTCHRPPPEGAHPPAVHEGCAGAGCHVDPPFAAAPPTRVGCLWCHEDRIEHEPDGVCSDCHIVTGPSPSSARPTTERSVEPSSPTFHADLQLRRSAR